MILISESASKQKVLVGYRAVKGMTDIQCRMAPLIQTRPTDLEVRSEDIIAPDANRELKLNGDYLANIQVRDMIAKVDGVRWQLRGIRTDLDLGGATRDKGAGDESLVQYLLHSRPEFGPLVVVPTILNNYIFQIQRTEHYVTTQIVSCGA